MRTSTFPSHPATDDRPRVGRHRPQPLPASRPVTSSPVGRVLVTGGAGFIGSHLVTRLLDTPDVTRVTVLDALTYAGHRHNLAHVAASPKFAFVRGDICDADLVHDVVGDHDAVVHLAAESHVERSISNASRTVQTNVVGTQILLAAALRTGIDRFVHVSTDEVYGPLVTGVADESAPLRPTVPYAASKAAADLIALSYYRTFGLPVCVTRSSNNYGPHQYPEKIIPLFVSRLLRGEPVTIHGEGRHVRNWLHVADHCAGLELVLRAGRPGEVYNIGGGTDLSTVELTRMLLSVCGADTDCVTHIADRPANDIRYAMTWDKIATELGYQPQQNMAEGLRATVEWYRAHPERWAPAAATLTLAGKAAV